MPYPTYISHHDLENLIITNINIRQILKIISDYYLGLHYDPQVLAQMAQGPQHLLRALRHLHQTLLLDDLMSGECTRPLGGLFIFLLDTFPFVIELSSA